MKPKKTRNKVKLIFKKDNVYLQSKIGEETKQVKLDKNSSEIIKMLKEKSEIPFKKWLQLLKSIK